MSASAVLAGAAALASVASNYVTQTKNMKNQLDINNKNIGMQLAYNADQVAVAQMNNQTQIDLANTAHQREVMDLRDAGLNPILSATGGNGAAMPSLSGFNGSAGHADAYAAEDPLKELGVSARELGRYISDAYNAQVQQAEAAAQGAKIENDIQKEVLKSLKVEGALDRTKMLSEISAYDTMRHKVYDASGNEVLMMRDDGAIVLNSDYIADLAAAIKADLHNRKWSDVRGWIDTASGAAQAGAGIYSSAKGASLIPSRIQLNEAMTRKLNRSK